jgi:SEL1 protein
MALDTSAEAYLPVHLALIELRLVRWWQAYTGRADSPTFELRRLVAAAWAEGRAVVLGGQTAKIPEGGGLKAVAREIWREINLYLEWDTVLMGVLTTALGFVVALRMRQNGRGGEPGGHPHES